MDVVYTYRVGGGPEQTWCVVITTDALPTWATLGQLEYLAKKSCRTSSYWILRSRGDARICSKFSEALEVQLDWAKQLALGETIKLGRLAPYDLVLEILHEVT